jgi:hypothetical protein
MSDAVSIPGLAPAAIPLQQVMPWALFGILLLLALSFVGVEDGATPMMSGLSVHEFLHDGRHLLGFPCH